MLNIELQSFLKSFANLKELGLVLNVSLGMRGESYGKFYCHLVASLDLDEPKIWAMEKDELNKISWYLPSSKNFTIVKCNNVDEYELALSNIFTLIKCFGFNPIVHALPVERSELRKEKLAESMLYYRKDLESEIRNELGLQKAEILKYGAWVYDTKIILESKFEKMKTKEAIKILRQCGSIQRKIKDLIKKAD